MTPAPGEEASEPAPDAPALAPEGDEGATARINLRLPERLKAGIEHAAGRERLVRAAAVALANGDGGPRQRGGRGGQTYTGWVR